MSSAVAVTTDLATQPEGVVVRACAAGSSRAAAELYRRHHDRLVGFFVRRTRDRALSEDLAHDTMIRLLGAIGRFDDRRPVWPYLKVVAHNVLVDHVRKDARQVLVDPEEELEPLQAVQPDIADDIALAQHVRQAVAELPERQQVAVELRYDRGWSVDEAARFLGLSNGSFGQLLFRARRNLRSTLADSKLAGVLVPLGARLSARVRAAFGRARTAACPTGAFGFEGLAAVAVATGLTVGVIGAAFGQEAGRSSLDGAQPAAAVRATQAAPIVSAPLPATSATTTEVVAPASSPPAGPASPSGPAPVQVRVAPAEVPASAEAGLGQDEVVAVTYQVITSTGTGGDAQSGGDVVYVDCSTIAGVFCTDAPADPDHT